MTPKFEVKIAIEKWKEINVYMEWHHAGKQIELKKLNGEIDVATLCIAGGYFFNGDDEYPIYDEAKLQDGTTVQLKDYIAWRLIDKTET